MTQQHFLYITPSADGQLNTDILYLPAKWLYIYNSLVAGSCTFHNDDEGFGMHEGHRSCMVITLIMVDDSKCYLVDMDIV